MRPNPMRDPAEEFRPTDGGPVGPEI
jgi:hypothetical protein